MLDSDYGDLSKYWLHHLKFEQNRSKRLGIEVEKRPDGLLAGLWAVALDSRVNARRAYLKPLCCGELLCNLSDWQVYEFVSKNIAVE